MHTPALLWGKPWSHGGWHLLGCQRVGVRQAAAVFLWRLLPGLQSRVPTACPPLLLQASCRGESTGIWELLLPSWEGDFDAVPVNEGLALLSVHKSLIVTSHIARC